MNGVVKLLDVVTGAVIGKPSTVRWARGFGVFVYSVAFSGNNAQTISGSDDKTVRLWDVITAAATAPGEILYYQRWSSSPPSPGCREEDSEPCDGNEPYPQAVTSELWWTRSGSVSG